MSELILFGSKIKSKQGANNPRVPTRGRMVPPVGRLTSLRAVMSLLVVAAIGLAAWVYLVGFHGGFWITSRYNDLPVPAERPQWPDIVTVIPARDEAPSIGDCIRSVLSQPYAGRLSVVLVDDQSSDGTAQLAEAAAAGIGAADRLTVITGRTPPAGWTGKLWALKQGIERVEARDVAPTYVLLTDADIVYSGDVLARLVTRKTSVPSFFCIQISVRLLPSGGRLMRARTSSPSKTALR